MRLCARCVRVRVCMCVECIPTLSSHPHTFHNPHTSPTLVWTTQAAYGFLGDVMRLSEEMRGVGPSRYEQCVECGAGEV
jgi:hypothetical protein